MDAQYASVSVQAAKIRKGPSTDEGIVETLSEGTQVVVSGKSGGSDGKDWYYVTFTGSDGSEKTGFVRYDLVTLGDMLPEEETPEQPVEEVEQTQNINNDFELKYEQDGDGYAWYLYDNRDSQVASRQKLEPLLEAVDQAMSDNSSDNTDMVVKQRIVIVVLVVLAVVLATAVLIMAFKLRDVYYEDYEEEDDEEEEEPEETVRSSKERVRSSSAKEKKTASEEGERNSGRRTAREENPERQRSEKKPAVREVTYQEEPDVSVPVQSAPKRKSKNFLLDDDDFEFEFLNMDEKDLE
jgi:hypothetical protein